MPLIASMLRVRREGITETAGNLQRAGLSDYYHCMEDYFETFARIYDEHFSHQYGFWRPFVEQVIYRYLDCGDLHNDFARVKCRL